MPALSPLSAEQALDTLTKHPDRYQTRDDLADLVRSVSVETPEDTTVLYSGNLQADCSANDLCIAMSNQGESIRIINNTEAAKFLESDELLNAIAQVHGTTAIEVRDDRTNPGNDFLFNGKDGLWAQTSERFVNGAHGNLLTATPYANGTRVFAQVELLTALNNETIHSINDIPKEVFQHIYEQTGSLEVVNKAVAASSFDRMQDMQFSRHGRTIMAVDTASFLHHPSAGNSIAPTPGSGAMQPLLLPGQDAVFDEGRRLLQEARLALETPKAGPFAVLHLNDTSTAAFEDLGWQVAISSVLVDAADKLQNGMKPPFPLQDTNGNDIGTLDVSNHAAAGKFDVDGKVRIEVDMSHSTFAADPNGQLAHCVMQAADHIDQHGADANFVITVPGGDIVGKVEMNKPSFAPAPHYDKGVEFDAPSM